jgi:hypothetical protein
MCKERTGLYSLYPFMFLSLLFLTNSFYYVSYSHLQIYYDSDYLCKLLHVSLFILFGEVIICR